MKVKGNVVTLAVTHKATIPGNKKDVWFRKYAITNTIDIKNLFEQYQVTYNSIDKIFVLYRKYQEKLNMEFKMHESGLHCYNPTNKAVVLIDNVSENKQIPPKRQIKGADRAKNLYAKLGYPSAKYFRWIIKSQKIIECPVTVQDINIAHTIWGKNIEALKGKTTMKKPIHVEGEIVKTPKEIVRIHKKLFMTADIFSVNGIPFFI